jgi:hypothetical protein
MTNADPFWTARPRAPHYDIAQLMPADLPRSRRFETADDVEARSVTRQEILARESADSGIAAERLADCRDGYEPCYQVVCPICARQYRRWLSGAVLKFVAGESNVRTATIYCETFDEGELHLANLTKIHNRVRQRLRRAGIGNGCAIGGTEVSYRAENQDWLLHLHLVTVDVGDAVFDAARKSFGSAGVRVPVEVNGFADPPKQISYLQKFATFHRPGQQTSGARARAYPLPWLQFRELASWWARYEFEDFLFLVGARRRGREIVRNEKRGGQSTR